MSNRLSPQHVEMLRMAAKSRRHNKDRINSSAKSLTFHEHSNVLSLETSVCSSRFQQFGRFYHIDLSSGVINYRF